MIIDLVNFNRKSKPAKKEPAKKNARGMAYKVGTWDGKTKIENTNIPDPSSMTCGVTYEHYVEAYREARRRSRLYSKCDFDTGTGGEGIVLIQFRETKVVGAWAFDKNVRERTLFIVPSLC